MSDPECTVTSDATSMATSGPEPRAEGAPTSLDEVRARIDAIDAELTLLLARRQRLVEAAATFKTDENAVRAPDRAQRIMAAARERALDHGLAPEVAEAVWGAMVNAFIDLELRRHRSG